MGPTRSAAAALLIALSAGAAAQAQSQPAAPEPTQPAAEPTAPAGPTADVIGAHRRVLEKTIADMKAGRIDYASMSNELAEKVRASEAAITPALQGMGKLQSLEFIREQQGALKFRAVFEQAQATWFIAVGPDGKIAFLVMRAG